MYNYIPTESKFKFNRNNCLQFYKCYGELITITNNINYLGIQFGGNMKWKEQIKQLVN